MFRHVGIVVENLELMSKFYQDVIGLELMYDEIEDGEFIQYIVGFDKAKAHIHKLGKNGNTIIELLSWENYYKCSYCVDKIFQKGITHFALTIDNIDDVILRTHVFINKPKISDNGKVKVAFCQDPEGNFIELVECISEE